jgi:hypothetical protein
LLERLLWWRLLEWRLRFRRLFNWRLGLRGRGRLRLRNGKRRPILHAMRAHGHPHRDRETGTINRVR